MKLLSRSRFINLLAGGMGLSGLGYLAYLFGYPEILSRVRSGPHIILMSIDTLRADYFTPDLMPETFRWVNENCLNFSNAHANSTWTRPSHLTMLSGSLSHEHKVELWTDLIPKKITMVQQELKRVGYKTTAFTGGGHLGSHFGFSRGFDHWQEEYPTGSSSYATAKDYLSEGQFRHPVFLFLHTFQVHNYGRVKKNFVKNAAKYDKAVRAFDKTLIDIINSILASPISENLRMIITSDHGEGFGEKYDLYGTTIISDYHGDFPCPSQVRIPLVVYDSQNSTTNSTDRLVGLEEVYHTIKDWAGFDMHRGRSLLGMNQRISLLSETTPFYHPERGRGCAVIVGKGEYKRTYIEKHENRQSEKKVEFFPEVRKKLKALGYLE